jgi:hypothetical protein
VAVEYMINEERGDEGDVLLFFFFFMFYPAWK